MRPKSQERARLSVLTNSVFDEYVPFTEQRHERGFDQFCLSDDDLADFGNRFFKEVFNLCQFHARGVILTRPCGCHVKSGEVTILTVYPLPDQSMQRQFAGRYAHRWRPPI